MRCEKTDCFAYKRGKCEVLTEVLPKCSFYKINEHYTNGIYYAHTPHSGYMRKETVNGKEIKWWRKLNGISQGEMAEELGVSQSTVAYWESGARQIPAEWIDRLKELGVELDG